MDEVTCPICLDNLNGDQLTLPCGHTFCLGCIEPWTLDHRHNTCPYCRQPIVPVVQEEEEGDIADVPMADLLLQHQMVIMGQINDDIVYDTEEDSDDDDEIIEEINELRAANQALEAQIAAIHAENQINIDMVADLQAQRDEEEFGFVSGSDDDQDMFVSDSDEEIEMVLLADSEDSDSDDEVIADDGDRYRYQLANINIGDEARAYVASFFPDDVTITFFSDISEMVLTMETINHVVWCIDATGVGDWMPEYFTDYYFINYNHLASTTEIVGIMQEQASIVVYRSYGGQPCVNDLILCDHCNRAGFTHRIDYQRHYESQHLPFEM